jgi:hypothetical protein
MMIKYSFPYRTTFSKLLLALSILFSGLTFLGDTDNFPPQVEETLQTEQLHSGNGSKNATSFHQAFAFSLIQSALTACIKEHKYVLLLSNRNYSRLHKVNQGRVQSFDIVKKNIANIQHAKTSSEEKPSFFLLG